MYQLKDHCVYIINMLEYCHKTTKVITMLSTAQQAEVHLSSSNKSEVYLAFSASLFVNQMICITSSPVQLWNTQHAQIC